MCLQRSSAKASELEEGSPTVSGSPTDPLTPPTAWLMRAKQGRVQVLCHGASTVSGHRSRSQAWHAQKHRLLALQWMASSRGCRVWPAGFSQGQCRGRSRGLPPGPYSSRGLSLSHFLGGSSSDTLSSCGRRLVAFNLCQFPSIVSKFHQNIFIGSKHE